MLDFIKRAKCAADARRLFRSAKGRSAYDFVETTRRLVAQGEWSSAARLAKDGVRRFPRSAALQDQARLLWMRCDRETARALEASALEGDVEARIKFSEHLEDAGEIDRAVDEARAACEIDPTSSNAARQLARTLVRRFRRDAAAADGLAACVALARAEVLSPEDAVLAALRGHLESGLLPPQPDGESEDVPVDRAMLESDGGATPYLHDALTDVEARDGAFAPESEEEAAETSIAFETFAAEIAASPGVRRASWSGGGGEGGSNATYAAFASAVGPSVGRASKRLGGGAVQEAEIAVEDARIHLFWCEGGVLAVEVDARARVDALVHACRTFATKRQRAVEDFPRD